MLWRAIAVAAVLAALAWAYHLWADHQREIGRDEIRVEWQADKLARAEQNRILLMANAKTSSDLQAAADKERKVLHEQNRSIGLELAESLKRLRNRPDRPEPADGASGVPAVAGPSRPGSGDGACTGAGLYKADGEFLERLAADSKRLQATLRSCRATYQRAQSAWNSVTPSQP